MLTISDIVAEQLNTRQHFQTYARARVCVWIVTLLRMEYKDLCLFLPKSFDVQFSILFHISFILFFCFFSVMWKNAIFWMNTIDFNLKTSLAVSEKNAEFYGRCQRPTWNVHPKIHLIASACVLLFSQSAVRAYSSMGSRRRMLLIFITSSSLSILHSKWTVSRHACDLLSLLWLFHWKKRREEVVNHLSLRRRKFVCRKANKLTNVSCLHYIVVCECECDIGSASMRIFDSHRAPWIISLFEDKPTSINQWKTNQRMFAHTQTLNTICSAVRHVRPKSECVCSWLIFMCIFKVPIHFLHSSLCDRNDGRHWRSATKDVADENIIIFVFNKMKNNATSSDRRLRWRHSLQNIWVNREEERKTRMTRLGKK